MKLMKPPATLQGLQKWFGSIITRGIDANSSIKSHTPSGNSIIEEAASHIAPSPTLQPWQRIEIYNQQYWWRLLNILHEMLPLTTRLFGYRDFNDILATPYLERYPPNDWSLNCLGERLPEWILQNYQESDQKLIYDAVCVDLAFNRGFFSLHHPPLKILNDDIESLLDTPLALQPSITLFALPYDLLSFREELIKEENGNHFLDHPLPPLNRTPSFFIVYRDLAFNMRWDSLEEEEYELLHQFEKGSTLDNACENISEITIQNKLASWFEAWTSDEWVLKR